MSDRLNTTLSNVEDIPEDELLKLKRVTAYGSDWMLKLKDEGR